MSERGKPFEPGNRFGKGRPKGSENNQKSLRLQELLLARGEEITGALIARAKKGDRTAMSLAMDRLIPRLKEVGVLPVEDRAKLPLHIRLRFVDSPQEEAEHRNASTPTTAEHTTIEDDDDDPASSESADEQHGASGEAANAPDANHDSTENDRIAHIAEQLRQTGPHVDHITALCEYEQRRRRPVRTRGSWAS